MGWIVFVGTHVLIFGSIWIRASKRATKKNVPLKSVIGEILFETAAGKSKTVQSWLRGYWGPKGLVWVPTLGAIYLWAWSGFFAFFRGLEVYQPEFFGATGMTRTGFAWAVLEKRMLEFTWWIPLVGLAISFLLYFQLSLKAKGRREDGSAENIGKLYELKKSGAITDSEFDEMKKKVINE